MRINLMSAALALAFSSAANVWAAGSPAEATPAPSASADQRNSDGESLAEVSVIAKRDLPTLNREIQQFVLAHAKPAARIGQVGRWHEPVCPFVSGLQGAARGYVLRRLTDVARAVGARADAIGKACNVNVEVNFTPSPQELLDHIVKNYRPLLGYFPSAEQRQAVIFSRPIQSWYVTGTRTMDYRPPIGSRTATATQANEMYTTGLNIDPFDSADSKAGVGPSGVAGSHLSKGQRSEFLHVLIIVDSKAITRFSLHSVSDYIAMLALTRLGSLNACSELPSIVNLLANNCATTPMTITAADVAYLKGLYGADLEKNLNVEQGDIHARMLQAITSR